MVWIHGGAFVNGSGALPIYSGLALALKGDVVVVTINYRLGALGYLYVPGVTANVGQLDQIAALEWVRDNIETFGGDPGNVTIFGESAGGMAVITLLAMPAARGLFHRIISQSGPFFDPRPNEKTSKMLFRKLNLKNGDMEGLRAIEVEKIKKAQDEIRAQNPKELLEFSPRIDGDTLPIHPLEALKNGTGKDMELLIGCTLEESKLFTALNPAIKKMKDDELKQIAFDYLSNAGIKKKNQEKLYELYTEAKRGHSLFDLMNTIITDQLFRIPAIRYAEQQLIHQPNVYMYTYTWASPALKGQLGACHAIELAFVFGTLKAPRMDIFFGKGPDADNLSEKTMDAWLAFAKNGNPNHDGIPEWPVYDLEKRSTIFFGKEIEVIEKPFEKERAGWEELF